MTLSQFSSLSGDIQRNVVQYKGVFLLGRTVVGAFAKLYQIEGFYVELFFDDKMSEVVRLKAFDDPDKLEPYLRQVNVSVIYELLS